MNLPVKEFVAAQDPDDPGVLVLSQFSGAAEQMDAALLINPFSREEYAEAIHRAAEMPRDERIERWSALFDGICRDNLSAWQDRFLTDLREPLAEVTADIAAIEPSHSPKLVVGIS